MFAAGMGVPLLAALNAALGQRLGSAVAAVIDATGLLGLAVRPVSGPRLLGLAVMAVGVFLSQRG